MPVVRKQIKTVVRAVPVGSDILTRVQPIGEMSPYLKILLYGESRTGKTTLWGTFPKKILCLVCSGGNKTGEVRSINTPENRGLIDVFVVEKSSEVKEISDRVKVTGGYETVVLDHVSGLQDLVLKEILNIDELPPQLSWGLASQQQYGQCTLQCKTLLRYLLNLDCNTVIIGQERVFKGKEDGLSSDMIQPTVGVAVSPSLAGWLNPACDYILQTFIRPVMVDQVLKVGKDSIKTRVRGSGVEYCVRAEPHDVYYTKFRVPKGHKIPDVIVDPDYDKINSVILGE